MNESWKVLKNDRNKLSNMKQHKNDSNLSEEELENNVGILGKLKSRVVGRRKLHSNHSQSLREVNNDELFRKVDRRKSSTVSIDSDIGMDLNGDCGEYWQSKYCLRKQSSSDLTSTDGFFPYEMGDELPEYFTWRAEIELGETPEKRQAAIDEMREIIQDSKKDFRTDEFFLITFLRGKKFDAKRAVRQVDNFYEFQNHCKSNPFDTRKVNQELEKEPISILPYRDPQGRAVVLVKLGLVDPDLLPINERFSHTFLTVTAIAANPATQIMGLASIYDMSGLSLKWMWFLSIKNIKLMFFMYFSSIPLRYKSIHIVNQSFIFTPIYQVLQKIGPRKIMDRFYIHGKNVKSLHKYFPPAILPPEYGGTLNEPRKVFSVEEVLNSRLLK